MTDTPTQPQPITDRQRQVLDFVGEFAREHGYCASVRDVMNHMGFLSPNGAMCHLIPLRRKGYVTWEAQTARSIRLVEDCNATA